MTEIKSVIWDLAGVLLLTIKGTFNSLLAERLDAPLKEIERVMSTPENDQWDMDEIDDDTFYTFLLNELGMPMEKKSILRKFVLDDFYVDQELLTYIRNLHRSYSTALLTNFPAHLHDFRKTDWIMDGAFDDLIASCDVKLLKPDPAIYKLTLELIGYRAEETVFIDDREVNVKAAENLGMNILLYENRPQTIKDLEAILQK